MSSDNAENRYGVCPHTDNYKILMCTTYKATPNKFPVSRPDLNHFCMRGLKGVPLGPGK